MIYLCRHGETDFNRQGRLQGRMETALTTLGERQAAAMADLLHGLIARDPSAPWRLIASPMRRTRATAEIVATRLGLPVELDARLVEIDVGDWEGLLRSDLVQARPDAFADPEWIFRTPGGETYEAVMDRVSDWLEAQADEPDRRLIVVSHGVAGRMLRGAYAGLGRAQILQSDAPQDAIYRLAGGRLDRLACTPVASDPQGAPLIA